MLLCVLKGMSAECQIEFLRSRSDCPAALITTFPSFQPPATTLVADAILRHFHRPYYSLYKPHIGLHASFGFLNPEDGTDRLS